MWHFLEHYDEDIENIFVAETDKLEQKICYELTKACEGVDRSKKEKEQLEVKINDKKQTVQRGPLPSEERAKDSGPEMFNVNINEKGAAEKLVSQINKAISEDKQNEINEDEDDESEDDESEGDESEDDTKNLTDNIDEDKTEL